MRRMALPLFALMLPVPAMAQQFPLTVAHKFGTTVIETVPAKVASLDYGGIDNLLAVGVSPVAVREWRTQDGYAFTAGPWSETLRTTDPVILTDDIDFEALVLADPDVIVAVYSGIDQATYDKLSLIAPVVAVPEGVEDYSLSWQDRALWAARATGHEDQAVAQIASIDAQIAAIAAAHPDWAGKSAVIGGVYESKPWAYTPLDGRAGLLASLGFISPPAVAKATALGEFYVEYSAEDLTNIDADLLVYYDTTEEAAVTLAGTWRQFLRAPTTGAEIVLGQTNVSALAHLSLLSLPAFLTNLEPMIVAALDGDPTTHADQRPKN